MVGWWERYDFAAASFSARMSVSTVRQVLLNLGHTFAHAIEPDAELALANGRRLRSDWLLRWP